MSVALAIEWLKFRRSAIARVATAFAGLVSPALVLGMVALARTNLVAGPSRHKFALALLGTRCDAHLALAAQALPVVMMLSGGLLTAWIFGREFVEGTLSGLFALPVSRAQTGLAKTTIVGAWSVAMALSATLLVVAASALSSPSCIDVSVLESAAKVCACGTIMGLLGLPFGLVAVSTRGYFGAFAALLLATGVSQLLASIGWGRWVPFVAPALWAGAGGAEMAATVRPMHLLFALSFAVSGALGTVYLFRRVRIG
jgi:hypothetical protein